MRQSGTQAPCVLSHTKSLRKQSACVSHERAQSFDPPTVAHRPMGQSAVVRQDFVHTSFVEQVAGWKQVRPD